MREAKQQGSRSRFLVLPAIRNPWRANILGAVDGGRVETAEVKKEKNHPDTY
ncbi:MAG: hypothetical protein H5T72_00010 [Actinobacteria bacterium]|nr:hypothetical protein [Actinomycetota bacterium]